MEFRFSADAGGPKLDEAFKKLLPVGEGSATNEGCEGCEGCEGSGLITVRGKRSRPHSFDLFLVLDGAARHVSLKKRMWAGWS
jgi:hypothetical protein